MHNTIAFSGGFKYRPTTSMSLSSNFGSLDTLNVSTRCGAKPRSDQIRCTVAGLTPTRLAIVRHDQCVAPGGVVVVVNRTISAIVSSGIEGLRPRPSRILLHSGQPVGGESCTPGPHRHRRHPDLFGDHRVGHPVSGHQQHPRPQHLPMRRRLRPRQPLQRLTLTVGNGNAAAGALIHQNTEQHPSYLRDTPLANASRRSRHPTANRHAG